MRDRFMQSRAKELRRGLTPAEQRLWRYLRRHYISECRFRRQVPIGPYIADFACLQPRLVVEVDGGQHETQVDYDRARDAFLQEQGFRVLRFWSSEVLNRTEAVLEVIWKALEELKRPPS